MVGVPEITPPELSDKPSGREPDGMDQWYGAVPPVTVRVCEYAVAAVPEGSWAGVMTSLMVSV